MLRAAMKQDHPELALDDGELIQLKFEAPKIDAKGEGSLSYPIADYYLTNAICRASPTMRRCSAELVHGEDFAEAAE